PPLPRAACLPPGFCAVRPRLRHPPPPPPLPYTTLFRSSHWSLERHISFGDCSAHPVQFHGPTAPSGLCDEVVILWQLVFMISKRSEEHTSELQSRFDLVCRLLLAKKKERQRRLQSLRRS